MELRSRRTHTHTHTPTHIFQKPCIWICNTSETNYNMFLQQLKLLSQSFLKEEAKKSVIISVVITDTCSKKLTYVFQQRLAYWNAYVDSLIEAVRTQSHQPNGVHVQIVCAYTLQNRNRYSQSKENLDVELIRLSDRVLVHGMPEGQCTRAVLRRSAPSLRRAAPRRLFSWITAVICWDLIMNQSALRTARLASAAKRSHIAAQRRRRAARAARRLCTLSIHRYCSKLSLAFPIIDGARKLQLTTWAAHSCSVDNGKSLVEMLWNTVERENRESVGTVTM